jgi:hypothetical protein
VEEAVNPTPIPVALLAELGTPAKRIQLLENIVASIRSKISADGGSYCNPEPFSCPPGADHECCLLCYAYYLSALNIYAAEDPPNEQGCYAAWLAWQACKAQCPKGSPNDGGCGCGKA